MSARVAVVTGATSGIGRAAALALARRGDEVIALGRNEDAGRRLEVLGGRSRGRIRFHRVDFTSLQDVRRAAAEMPIADCVDLLVNNAGARFDTYAATVDGFERTFAVNHLAHFLLTALVFDRLLASRDGRILAVGSGAHAATLDRGWVLPREAYDRSIAYAVSKLANIVTAYELARRLAPTNLTANALDPGGVATNLGRNNGLLAWARHLAYYASKRELKSAARAGDFVVRIGSDPDLSGVTGKYFAESGEIRSSALSYDRICTDDLWTASIRWTGLDASVGEAWKYFVPQTATADEAGRDSEARATP